MALVSQHLSSKPTRGIPRMSRPAAYGCCRARPLLLHHFFSLSSLSLPQQLSVACTTEHAPPRQLPACWLRDSLRLSLIDAAVIVRLLSFLTAPLQLNGDAASGLPPRELLPRPSGGWMLGACESPRLAPACPSPARSLSRSSAAGAGAAAAPLPLLLRRRSRGGGGGSTGRARRCARVRSASRSARTAAAGAGTGTPPRRTPRARRE